MTSTRVSAYRATRARRLSSLPGVHCSACTIRMSPGRRRSRLAKRINVAHDWLSDPDLRRRYDRERSSGGPGRPAAPWPVADWAPPVRRPVRRPPTTAETRRLRRGARRAADERRAGSARPRRACPDRVPGHPTPGSSHRSSSGSSTRPSAAHSPTCRPAARRSARSVDAVVGRLADILLGDTLDDILGDPASIWARERLTRGWDSAVGQPRYGPASAAVIGCWAPPCPHRRRPGVSSPGPARSSGSATRRGPSRRRPRKTMPCASRASSRPATPSPPSMPRSSGRGRRASERSRLPDARPRGSPTCSSCGTHSRRPRSSDTRPHGSAV